jgi:hypothetical protein
MSFNDRNESFLDPADSDEFDPLLVGDEGEESPTTTTTTTTVVASNRTLALTKLRRFLKSHVQFMGTASHQDQVLKFAQWTLWLASTMLQLHTKKSSKAASSTSTSTVLRKLYADISMARYVSRLLGFPAALEATLSGSWSGAQESTQYPVLHTVLGQIMSISMMGYYPIEHGAWVQWLVPSLAKNRSAERLSAWSCRFWLVYIVAEAAQNALRWKELRQQETTEGSDNSTEIRNTQLQLTRDALFLLPCIQWSLPNWDTQPCLSEFTVNGLSWLESVVCIYQSIRNSREVVKAKQE